ncbi:hypothetical protein BYT27DRAFT_7263714 [Phlegmacium glaucopus]|nr:hypothetical protein BYT27DRAFT_7263714 [Phlegmacium glaucopus]
MSANLTHNQSGHRLCPLTQTYNTQERAAIDVFKDQYLEATSPATRKTIAQLHIFPALFNYWGTIGEVIDDREMELRTVLAEERMAPSKKGRIDARSKIPAHRLPVVDKAGRHISGDCVHDGTRNRQHNHAGVVPLTHDSGKESSRCNDRE